ncbi:hypothetical protein [Halocynthiibacter sp.]|uniref:hypothetical protein n=1 Tax=Halocynthiibacter sp. TaxID=1979210 RepID=UPI003C434772
MIDLQALSDAATQGDWGQSHRQKINSDMYATEIYATCDARNNSIACLHWHSVKTETGYRTDRQGNAEYIVALVNAHRSGDLVTRADMEAAVVAEREACAVVALNAEQQAEHIGKQHPEDSMSRAAMFGRSREAGYIAAAIRARGDAQ